jgi:hypothetical protein
MLKMPKTLQIHQKYIYLIFCLLFFGFKKKSKKKRVKDWVITILSCFIHDHTFVTGGGQ